MKFWNPVFIFAFIFMGISLNLNAQQQIPEFNGTDLNGNSVEIPNALHGKKSLIGFAISPKIQDQLSAWIQPVYDELLDTNSLASLVYDAEVMLVICFNQSNIKFKNRVERELHENVLPECYRNVILTDSDSKMIANALGIEDKTQVNLFTLDPSGKITSKTIGAYSDKKFEKMTSHLEID